MSVSVNFSNQTTAIKRLVSLNRKTFDEVRYTIMTGTFWVVARPLLCGYIVNIFVLPPTVPHWSSFLDQHKDFPFAFPLLFSVSPLHSSLAQLIIALRWLWPFQWHSTIRLLSHCQCSRAVIYEVTSQKWTLAIMYFQWLRCHTKAKSSARTHAHTLMLGI